MVYVCQDSMEMQNVAFGARVLFLKKVTFHFVNKTTKFQSPLSLNILLNIYEQYLLKFWKAEGEEIRLMGWEDQR